MFGVKITGSPLSASKRLQFSIDMVPIPEIDCMKSVPSTLMPMFWMEESVHLNETYTKVLKNQLFRYVCHNLSMISPVVIQMHFFAQHDTHSLGYQMDKHCHRRHRFGSVGRPAISQSKRGQRNHAAGPETNAARRETTAFATTFGHTSNAANSEQYQNQTNAFEWHERRRRRPGADETSILMGSHY